jgi:hypothetical protein
MNTQRTVLGEYVVVDPLPLIFTWGWEDSSELPPGSSTVEITLIPDGDGTLIRLRHTGLPSEESRALHAAGWSHYLERLSLRPPATTPDPTRSPRRSPGASRCPRRARSQAASLAQEGRD